jgi:hypothetical protein
MITGHSHLTSGIPSFKVEITASPLTLTWPAVPGLSYNILACTILSAGFQQVATVIASEATARWPIASPSANESYYRVELVIEQALVAVLFVQQAGR